MAYGLAVCEGDASTKKVVSVSCKFCLYFGRDMKIGAKRKTENIQYFKKLFRSDNYSRHMLAQHSSQWKAYRKLSSEEKTAFLTRVSMILIAAP